MLNENTCGKLDQIREFATKNNLLKIPSNSVIQALNAMYWTFSPYLDYVDDPESSIHDYPWIVELINSYNELTACLSVEERYEHKIIEF